MALLETKDLYKIYEVGENVVHALDGVSVTIDGESLSLLWAPRDRVSLHS